MFPNGYILYQTEIVFPLTRSLRDSSPSQVMGRGVDRAEGGKAGLGSLTGKVNF